MASSDSDLERYFDTAATTPPAPPVLAAMATTQQRAWANPSSLHGFGLAAAEQLERSRIAVATGLHCHPEEVVFTSGGTEAIHLALLGAAQGLEPGRLLISAVEHPATQAAARRLQSLGWTLAVVPVDRQGVLDLEWLERLLAPPTRLVSLIWGQNEVGTLAPVAEAGRLCRQRGVLLHVDAVQVVGQRPLAFGDLPIDLLSFTAHKLLGPRGIGALLVRRGVPLAPQLGGGGQEGGRRAGTEPVVLAAGLAAALELALARLGAPDGLDRMAQLRDALLTTLLRCPGIALTGPAPGQQRLPQHISLLLRGSSGRPLPGRAVVRALARQGFAASSGSACSSGAGSSSGGASAVLLALGYDPLEAAAGLRLSLGPWHRPQAIGPLVDALGRALAAVERNAAKDPNAAG